MNSAIQHTGFLDLPPNMTPALCCFCGHRTHGSARGREIVFCKFTGERLKADSMAYLCEGFHTQQAETSTKVFS